MTPRFRSAERWLAEHRDGGARDEALVCFRDLPPVSPDQMLGR